MGRNIGAAGDAGLITPYRAGRLYGMPGLSGPTESRTGLITQPLQLRPGVWSLTGLWAVVGSAGVSTAGATVRLGLYADTNGRPGALIKDAGTATVANRSIAKATFDPLVLDATEGMDVHLVAISAGGVFTAQPHLFDYGASDDDWLARYGLDQAAALYFNPTTGSPTIPRAVNVAGVSHAPALANNPNLAAGVSCGAIYGGLIFG